MMPARQAARRAAHPAPVRGRDLVEEGETGRCVRDETTADQACAHGLLLPPRETLGSHAAGPRLPRRVPRAASMAEVPASVKAARQGVAGPRRQAGYLIPG